MTLRVRCVAATMLRSFTSPAKQNPQPWPVDKAHNYFDIQSRPLLAMPVSGRKRRAVAQAAAEFLA